jgi:DNA-binding winged helix-turn-helix (wHTH) protein
VATENTIYRFGVCELDLHRRRLTRLGQHVWLPGRPMEMLLCLVARPGQLVEKQQIVDQAWGGVAITDNNIVQAVRTLRHALGCQSNGDPYIETIKGRGYRLAALVERVHTHEASVPVEALVEPYQPCVEGQAALETLDLDAIAHAAEAFESALRLEPGFAPAHIGLANVHLLRFESTRIDRVPDLASVQKAASHAREGCRLSPSSGDAWGTLALVRHRGGEVMSAVAAARQAIALGSGEWRHDIRLAYVSWGEERLAAAHRALGRCHGLALAHWFAATVYVARQMWDHGVAELSAGCAAQDPHHRRVARFAAVGLHLLRGLVLAAHGDIDDALAEFERELAEMPHGHVYARESSANTWYAIGVMHLRRRQRAAAARAFQTALTFVPGHALALVGLSAAGGAAVPPREAIATAREGQFDAVIVQAAAFALQAKHADAARVCAEALDAAGAGPAGWPLPVEPLLYVSAQPDAWAGVLATLRARAR